MALFACGAVLIAAAVATGDAEVSLVIIFPVFSGSSWMFLSGVLLVIAGFATFFMGMMTASAQWPGQAEPGTDRGAPPARTEARYGGVVLLGPVPIAFGSDKKTALIMLVIGVVLVALFIGLFVLGTLIG